MTIYNKPSDLPAWAESGDKVQPSNAEIQTGWPLSTVPPSRQRFNWLLNWLATGVRYFMQRGIPEWDDTEDYPQNGRTQHGGSTWVAIQANLGVEPGTDPLTWERWGYSESELNAFLDPITPDPTNNRVGINNATPLVTLDITATDAIKLPSGTTAQRPIGENGYIRHNSTLDVIEAWLSGVWTQIGGALPEATELVKGIIEIATNAETQTGSDSVRAVTPAGLKATALGLGQTWQDVAGSRASSVTYTNTTGRPIMINVAKTNSGSGVLYVGGVAVGITDPTAETTTTLSAIIPNNSTYQYVGTFNTWMELR